MNEVQSLDALSATYKTAAWLRDAGYQNLPDLQELMMRIEVRTLLEPFEHIAGTHFRGRVDELRRLRSHVGVAEPQSFAERASRVGAQIKDWAGALIRGGRQARRPLLVLGPGGVGKSTLIAKFILDHAEAHRQDRFPFGYLDFDRPDLSSDQPLTILAETVRQLGIEYPQGRERCDRVRQIWLARVEPQQTEASRDPSAAARLREAAVRDFVSLVRGLDTEDRPVLIVLDTFEEVQYRGTEEVEGIRTLLDRLGKNLPSLRLVIAGRSEIPDWDTQTMILEGFDRESSAAYLEARGVFPRELATRIYAKVGGSPLSLKLAADLWERLPSADRRSDGSASDRFLRDLGRENIEVQLYRRVLGHIQGEYAEELCRLAHPGLVLRRITPDLIEHVLAGPCEVEVGSHAKAQALFDAMAREVGLVTLDPDGALRHRADLRLLMVHLIHEQESSKARAIHEGAVDYYAQGRDSIPERAEEIYHRIWLDHAPEVISRRWRREVAKHLYSALPELNGQRKASLAAHLKVEVDDATMREARPGDWEALAAARVEKLLESDRAIDALDLIRTRSHRTPTSPLPNLEAKILARLGRLGEAIRLLDTALALALAQGTYQTARSHGLLLAELVLIAGDPAAAARTHELIDQLEQRRMPRTERLELYAKLALLADLSYPADPEHLANRIDDILRRHSDSALAKATGSALWAAAAPGGRKAQRLSRVVAATGFPAAPDSARRRLALAIASFDVAWSRKCGRPIGSLATRLDISVQGSVIETWIAVLVQTSITPLDQSFERMLRELHDDLTPELIAAFDTYILDGLTAYARPSAAVPGTDSPKAASCKIAPDDLAGVVAGLASAFRNLDALRDLLGSGLGRSLDAIVGLTETAGIYRVIGDLVEKAAQEGWLTSLLARALEARPENAELAKAAAKVGIAGIAGIDEAADSLEPQLRDAWRDQMRLLATQVCRIEQAQQTGAAPRGTGFLVAADLVLTACPVIGAQDASRADIFCRFDHRVDQSGAMIAEGTTVRLAHEGVVVTGRCEEPSIGGFALLRLAEPVGVQPVGRRARESNALLRRWIEVPETFPSMSTGDPLFILHHANGGPLKVSVGKVLNEPNGADCYYDIFSAPGSSGAPCFSADLKPIAMHIGFRSGTGAFGFGLDAVVAGLNAKGLGHLLRTRFE